MMSITRTITAFLESIGLDVRFDVINEPSFVPGILIQNGGLIIDEEKLKFVGDILHEAGHLAVMPLRIRQSMNGDIGTDDIHQGGELAAIAWSYAACLHLRIDPYIVFHESGYKGGGKSIVENFENGAEMGVPLLVWTDMTESVRSENEAHRFPKMKNWLCEIDRHRGNDELI